MNNRQLFQQYVAQTSPSPVGLEIVSASGNYLYDVAGNKYLDLIGGISVCNVGHGHPAVTEAIKKQADLYLHVMVYGELVQSPQVKYAELIARHMPEMLSCVYFTNSGTEATEGALKLARRATGRTDIISCNNAYHGHTLGALSVMGDEYWRNAFRPLMPGVRHYDYNSDALIAGMKINSDLGYEPVTYSELTQDEAFWQGCKSCVNHEILMSKGRKNCLCTAMLYDPKDHYTPEETASEFKKKEHVYARFLRSKQSRFLRNLKKNNFLISMHGLFTSLFL